MGVAVRAWQEASALAGESEWVVGDGIVYIGPWGVVNFVESVEGAAREGTGGAGKA